MDSANLRQRITLAHSLDWIICACPVVAHCFDRYFSRGRAHRYSLFCLIELLLNELDSPRSEILVFQCHSIFIQIESQLYFWRHPIHLGCHIALIQFVCIRWKLLIPLLICFFFLLLELKLFLGTEVFSIRHDINATWMHEQIRMRCHRANDFWHVLLFVWGSLLLIDVCVLSV